MFMLSRLFLMVLGCSLLAGGEDAIRLNQVGFHPDGPKFAVLVGDMEPRAVRLIHENGAEVAADVRVHKAKTWSYSGETARLIDFSSFDRPGSYRLSVEGVGESYLFRIAASVYKTTAAAALKSYYYNRCSSELLAEHARRWARKSGHPDTRILVHASAATPQRPEGTVLSSPKGWYDAGDYNKYIVNSGISTWSLLTAWQHRSEYFAKLDVNIPDSNLDLPDILEETMWNLIWMRTMQVPEDGSVYHKLSELRFSGHVMPETEHNQRYMIGRSTAAALDYAATMAMAHRVLKHFPKTTGLAANYLESARRAWDWAVKNPAILYRQPSDVNTGAYAYDNEDLVDEWFWAAVELSLATGDAGFLKQVNPEETPGGVPSWDYVAPLGWLSLAWADTLPEGISSQLVHDRILETAQRMLNHSRESAYGVAMGTFPQRNMIGAMESDWAWGSNGGAGYQGMILLCAYKLTGDRIWLDVAQANLDYLLGRNGTGYCFVTGIGSRSPMNIHHRVFHADGIAEPAPGFVAGGPHAGKQDAKSCPPYPSDYPASAYMDHHCSYATNENAINWNASLVYLTSGVDDLRNRLGVGKRDK